MFGCWTARYSRDFRYVRQTGFTFFTYPNASHSRFEHSLGVYNVANHLLESFKRTKEAFEVERRLRGATQPLYEPVAYESNDRDTRLLRHAALLHDLGHAVFSHVSERLFDRYSIELMIGGQTVREFQQNFRSHYELKTGDIQTGRRKPLAEMLTVALITSRRFEEFYALTPGRSDEEPFTDLCDMSALILGDQISPNDFALPEVLSGPVDADKIDYMLRDALACGLNIGIDVARLFVRAGVYQGAADSFRKPESARL